MVNLSGCHDEQTSPMNKAMWEEPDLLVMLGQVKGFIQLGKSSTHTARVLHRLELVGVSERTAHRLVHGYQAHQSESKTTTQTIT